MTLKTDHTFGRDMAINALAIRELALWSLKNESDLKRWAKAKAREYQAFSA